MALARVGNIGPWALLVDDGVVPSRRGIRMRAHRAITPPSSALLHVVDGDGDGWLDLHDSPLCHGLVHDSLPRADERTFGGALAFEFVPGVRLDLALAQARESDGELPLELATYVAHRVALAAAAMARASARPCVDELSAARVRLGFDGRVILWSFDGALASARPAPPQEDEDDLDDDFDDGDDPLAPPPWARVRAVRTPEARAPREDAPGDRDDEALAPEEVRGAPAGAPADVFRLGVLLATLLEGRAPPRGSRPSRALPAPLEALLRAALAHEPRDRPRDCAELAHALAPLVDAGARALTAGFASQLFPEQRRIDLEMIEEARMLDFTVIGSQQTASTETEPPRERRAIGAGVWAARLPVRNVDFIAFLDATHTPDPPGWFGRDPALATQPAVLVPPALAQAYARWRGGRLPSEREWALAARSDARRTRRADDLALLCRVWEWTTTQPAGRAGFVVRGGPWRNRDAPAQIDNRSWEDDAAPDVGFRVFYDRDE